MKVNVEIEILNINYEKVGLFLSKWTVLNETKLPLLRSNSAASGGRNLTAILRWKSVVWRETTRGQLISYGFFLQKKCDILCVEFHKILMRGTTLQVTPARVLSKIVNQRG